MRRAALGRLGRVMHLAALLAFQDASSKLWPYRLPEKGVPGTRDWSVLEPFGTFGDV